MASAKNPKSPGDTKAEESKPTLEDFHDQLDSLWISYLNYLDAYTTAQKTLQKHVSAGYLSLAKANFNTRDGIRRYGQDYYHDGAIATKRAAISYHEEDSKPSVEITQWSPPSTKSDGESEDTVEVERTGEKEEDVKQLPSPPGTPQPVTDESNDKGDAKADYPPAEKPQQKTTLESDPLRWFGILIPQPLRSAQTNFSSAVDECVAAAVNSAKGMRNAEYEIRKLRKAIKRAEKQHSAED